MKAEEYEWIGIIHPEDVKSEVIFITPLAYYGDGDWKPISLDARHQWFPNSGKAAIRTKEFPGAYTGKLWLFRTERNAQLIPFSIHAYAYYLVSSELESIPLAQIIDWTSRANHFYELIDLLEEGIEAKNCFCQRIYIYCQSRLYGPIRLEIDAEANRFKPREYLHAPVSDEQTLFVWMYTRPEEGFLDLRHAHPQFMFLDESKLDTPTGKEDWSLPQVAIKRVLEASRSVSTDDDIRLVDTLLYDLTHLTSREELFALHLEPATIKRAQYIVTGQIERLQDVREIIEHLPAEHPLMQSAREWAILTRSQEIEQAGAALVQQHQEQIQQLDEKRAAAQAKLDEIEQAVDVAQQRYERAIEAFNAFERTLQERLVALKEQPMRVLAELQITTALFPMLYGENWQVSRNNTVRGSRTLSSEIFQQMGEQVELPANGLAWNVQNGAESNSTSLDELSSHLLHTAARAMNVQPSLVRVASAALLAGLIPALTEEAALSTLQAISQVISRGRIVLVPVPVTALSTLDLFGTIDARQRMFIPASGGLADCILQAQEHPEELVLIVLEGVDRVPGMPVYVPLLRQYIEVRQAQGTIAPINLFHPRAVDPDDPYFKLAWFTWPHNVLFAVTLDGDMNGLALPSMCERWLVQFAVERSSKAYVATRKLPPSCSEISLHQWHLWEQEIRSQIKPPADSEVQKALDFWQHAFYTALTVLKVRNPDAVVKDIWPEQFEQADKEEAD